MGPSASEQRGPADWRYCRRCTRPPSRARPRLRIDSTSPYSFLSSLTERVSSHLQYLCGIWSSGRARRHFPCVARTGPSLPMRVYVLAACILTVAFRSSAQEIAPAPDHVHHEPDAAAGTLPSWTSMTDANVFIG